MPLGALLSQRGAAIVQRWIDLTLETYPPETSTFFREEKDSFTNPVGHTLRHDLNALYAELSQDRRNSDRLSAYLDNIIRIRAVQSLSPSQAIAFVFLLKKAVREEMGSETDRPGEISSLESRVDELALMAFDIYMKCRDQVHEIRVNEVRAQKERALRLLERVGLWDVASSRNEVRE